MAPEMLHRVVHGRADPKPRQKALHTFQPAVLHGYRRHRVRGADYPGIVPVPAPGPDSSATPSSSHAGTSVLGTLVSGLTDGDLRRLDIYEGDEYARQRVTVRTLRETLRSQCDSAASAAGASPDGHLRDVLDAAGAEFADEGEEVSAVTYVWVAGPERLEAAEWDFETFKRDKMAWWVAADESEW